MTQAAQLAQYGSNNVGLSFKNRIINGDMTIDQRNAGASVTVTNTAANTYLLDRWLAYTAVTSKFSIQQSSVAPTGFTNSLLVTSLAATTVGSSDRYYIGQFIEGFNTADLGFGTANAKTVTLSFWVRSSLTGTFGGTLLNDANNRNYPFTYTISAANTWEQKTVTIAGDTTGTWVGGTNGVGLKIFFGLGVGSSASGTAGAWGAGNFNSATGATSVVGTNGATWYVTGVQLEVGSVATSFDYLPYTTELLLCQRYFYKVTGNTGNNYMAIGSGVQTGTTGTDAICPLPVTMRAVPTTAFTGDIYCYDGVTAPTVSSVSAVYGGFGNIYLGITHTGGSVAGRGVAFYTRNNTASSFSFSAEL